MDTDKALGVSTEYKSRLALLPSLLPEFEADTVSRCYCVVLAPAIGLEPITARLTDSG